MTTRGENIINASGLFNNRRAKNIDLLRTNQYSLNKLKIYIENLNAIHNELNETLSAWENFQNKLQKCQLSLNETKKENDYTLKLIRRIESGDQEAIVEAEQFIKMKS